MFNFSFSLFSKTKSLEIKIDLFHDKLLEVAMNFKKAVRTYLNEQRSEEYRKISKQVKQIEHDADNLRRDIEAKLYTQNLIPDLRADVLNIVENIDSVINKFDEVTYKFYIEKPDIPEEYHSRFVEVCSLAADCAENLSIASRAFFRDFRSVRDYSQKVSIIENETDSASAHLKQSIFDSELPLANKLQLNNFVSGIASIAELSEDCVDELLIFTIKRDI